MTSMTGFGHAEGEGAGTHISVEIRSLNNRFLDLIISLPSSLSILESQVREVLQKLFSRGRIEVSVRIRDVEKALTVTVDHQAAQAWNTALTELSDILEENQKVTLDMLVRMDGVLKLERHHDSEAYWEVLEPLLTQGIQEVLIHREREGRVLAQDIENQLKDIEKSLEIVRQLAPEVQREVQENLRTRFREVLGDNIGEERILMEIASWAVKTDINEEVVRLETHMGAFRELSGKNGAKGKKLDFLAQEMGREINTIGSKSPQSNVGREVVNMKNALEKIREQLRNVE